MHVKRALSRRTQTQHMQHEHLHMSIRIAHEHECMSQECTSGQQYACRINHGAPSQAQIREQHHTCNMDKCTTANECQSDTQIQEEHETMRKTSGICSEGRYRETNNGFTQRAHERRNTTSASRWPQTTTRMVNALEAEIMDEHMGEHVRESVKYSQRVRIRSVTAII